MDVQWNVNTVSQYKPLNHLITTKTLIISLYYWLLYYWLLSLSPLTVSLFLLTGQFNPLTSTPCPLSPVSLSSGHTRTHMWTHVQTCSRLHTLQPVRCIGKEAGWQSKHAFTRHKCVTSKPRAITVSFRVCVRPLAHINAVHVCSSTCFCPIYSWMFGSVQKLFLLSPPHEPNSSISQLQSNYSPQLGMNMNSKVQVLAGKL